MRRARYCALAWADVSRPPARMHHIDIRAPHVYVDMYVHATEYSCLHGRIRHVGYVASNMQQCIVTCFVSFILIYY